MDTHDTPEEHPHASEPSPSHHHAAGHPAPPPTLRHVRGARAFILGGLSGGHTVFHWYTRSFVVALPYIQAEFGLSDTQAGLLITVREFSSGLVNLPGGLATDMFRRHWAVIMAGCMLVLGLGYILVGQSPTYPVLLVAMVIVALPPALWHLPAMSAMSHHFSHRRGMALGWHNTGGAIGDLAGPWVTGILIGLFTWRPVLSYYGIPAIALAAVVLWAFRGLGGDVHHERPSLKEQLRLAGGLLRRPLIVGLTTLAGLRAMAHIGFITFLPLYLANVIGMSSGQVGLHVGLLAVLGIFTAPILGGLSDRFGRRVVLVPAFLFEGGLVLALIAVGGGWLITLVVGLLGLFIFSTQPVIFASTLDVVEERGQGTGMGLLFTSRFALAALSPAIAGIISDNLGMGPTFYYLAALFLASALLASALPLGRPTVSAVGAHHH